MRILKFLGAFLGTLLVILLIVFGFNMNALITLFENSEDIQEGYEWVEKTYSLKGLTEYIGAQPERVSIASLSIENPDSSLLYNEHTPRTMGRLSNFFVITEYIRQFEKGLLNPDEQISLDEIDKYQLPYMDASTHEDVKNMLGDQGKISEQNTVALIDLVEKSAQYNDLAIADFLYTKVGQEAIIDLLDRLELEDTELPLPFSGLYITLKPSLHQINKTEAWMDSLSSMHRSTFDSLVVENTDKLFSDQDFRSKVKTSFEDDEGLGIAFKKLRDALAFFPKTTAIEMARIMKRLMQDKLISKKVSRQVKEIMSWPLDGDRLNKDFNQYGAIYDSRMGLVNGIDFGQSTYSNEPFAQAVFFDELQIAFWFHMSSNLMHQDFQQRLIWDPALREATGTQISNSKD
ncbi:MAG: serine hydrolase [Balneolaceae bacterium]|nr:serine hydrolase [Balneolaceae bacterium]